MSDGIVSPYEFHARSVGVYAALTLARRVVTAMPTDGAGDTSALRPDDVPRTIAAAEAWSWSGPLWREGVLTPAFDGAGPLDDVGDVCDEIGAVDAWAPIRPMIAPRLFDDTRAQLEAVSRDLILGGVNPGVSIPVSCGVARFAARTGALMFRSPASSTVTKLEARSTSIGARCAVPVLDGVDARTLLAMRETLAATLGPLRDAMDETVATLRSAGVTEDDLRGVERGVLMPAAEAYAREFEAHRRVLCERADDEGCRYRVRSLTLGFGSADPDGVLRASVLAAQSMRGRPATPRAGVAPTTPTTPTNAIGSRALAVCAVSVRKLAPTTA
ncbi:MAG: hypothetical protein AAGH64_00420 [Planctomycetota bacterium]